MHNWETAQGMTHCERMMRARFIARNAHKDQRDKGGELITDHTKRVADMAYALMGDVSVYEAAMMHDAVEDTDYTIENVTEDFGPEVAETVKLLTHVEGDSYDIYISKIVKSLNLAAITIKLCDLLDNTNPTRSTCDTQRKLRQRNVDKYLTAIRMLSHARAHLNLYTDEELSS